MRGGTAALLRGAGSAEDLGEDPVLRDPDRHEGKVDLRRREAQVLKAI